MLHHMHNRIIQNFQPVLQITEVT